MSLKAALPIDVLLSKIVQSLQGHPNLVLEAAPGAGKTTRVPRALLDALGGEVIVLEPRRIAARLAAMRVAAELGEGVGERVGYQVRFEEAIGPQTRLRFMTEGILSRRLISDPALKKVSAVVLDEFHERHVESDLALALLKRLQQSRSDLHIVIMSATLDAAPVAHYLGDCPVLRSEGRQFDLTIEHLPYSPQPLEAQVRTALELLTKDDPAVPGERGNILVFLPGIAEIRRAARECEPLARRLSMAVLPLHGDLSPAEQDRALLPGGQRKLILATNVAESSVTVGGVTAVIDSGLARFSRYSPWTGLPTLEVGRVSQASAKQRAGRAGRTAPGRVLRLYSSEDYLSRPEHDAPEIARSDLSQLCLVLRAMGVASITELDWLLAPPEAAVAHAESLLDRLGATGAMAQQLARYPLPPRLARLLVESIKRGVGEEGCVAAALLGAGGRSTKGDLLEAIEADRDAATRNHVEQLRRIARPPRQMAKVKGDDALLMAVLAGFPDRVTRRRAGDQVFLSSGGSAELAPGLGEGPPYEFMVAVDVEDRKDKPLPLVRMAARIEPEWLLDLFPERLREQSAVEWNRAAERVEAVSTLLYDQLIIQESRSGAADPQAAAELLAQKAMEAGIDRFVDPEALAECTARLEFAGFGADKLEETLLDLCQGLRSFAELRLAAVHFIPSLEQRAGGPHLESIAPARLKLYGGKQTRVHYESGKPPWIASRLQDFFGMSETPRIGHGRTPVVVHLLAPNQRPVQMTSDLAGFWERLYPQLRRELMRRYPPAFLAGASLARLCLSDLRTMPAKIATAFASDESLLRNSQDSTTSSRAEVASCGEAWIEKMIEMSGQMACGWPWTIYPRY